MKKAIGEISLVAFFVQRGEAKNLAGNRKEYELLFKLQAALGGNFHTAFQSAINTTKQMQNSLTKLHSITGKIDAYKNQESALESNRQKLALLTEEHEKLQQEMSQTETPTEALRKRMEKNEKQIAATTAKIEEHRQKLNSLGVELSNAGVNTANLSAENERLAKTYDKVKKSQEEVAKINTALGKNQASISQTKTQLAGTVGTIAAVGAAIYAGPVQSAMDFESSMSDVVKVVDGLKNSKTGELTQEYYKMRDALLDLSTKIPMTAEELTQIAAAAGQAGIARNELTRFSEDAAKMGVAFDTTATQAGEWMATWRTAFNMSQDQVVALADQINYLSNTANATAPQISEIVTKVGPLGSIAGLASAEVAALGTTLVATGVQEDVAATGIKKLMTTMTAGEAVTSRQQSTLDKLGISATELANRMQTDAKGAIVDFFNALNKLPEAEQAAALKNYFGEEAIAPLSKLQTNVALLEEQFVKVGDATQYAGSMEDEYAARSDTTQNKVELAKNSLHALSIAIGDTFLPLAGDVAENLRNIIVKLSAFADANPELVRRIAKVTTGLLAFKAATLTAKLGFLELRSNVLMLQKVMAVFKGKTALAGVETVRFSDKARKAAKRVTGYFGGIGNAAGGVRKSIGQIFSGTKIGNPGGAIGGTFSKMFSGIGGIATRVFAGTAGKISGIFSKAGTAIAAGPLGKIGGVIAKGLGKLTPLLAPLKNLGVAILGPFSGVLGKIVPIIGVITLIVAAIQLLRENLDKVRAVIRAVFGDAGVAVFNKMLASVTKIGNTIKGIFSDGNLGGVRSFLINLFGEGATETIDKSIQTFTGWATTIASIIQGAATVISSVAGIVVQIIQFLMPTIQNIIGTGFATISGLISGSLNTIKGIVDIFAGIFTGDWTRIWEGAKSIFSGVWESLKSIASGALNGIISLVNGVISGLNKLKIPDWVPGVGGKGINIPLIPQFAKGTTSTPDTFIAGEAGAELITNAKNRTVFTAAQTGTIFRNLAEMVNAIRTAGGISYQPALAGVPSVAAPSLVSGISGGKSVVIHSSPVFHVGNSAQAEDIAEMLRKHDEELLQEIDERERQRQEDERRRNYD